MVYTTYFRLLNERAIQVKGHQKAIEMLKSGQYANIADAVAIHTAAIAEDIT